jgi:lipopolysaccharide/colanic/teichoic acid biosynthesis glycosyltransferase
MQNYSANIYRISSVALDLALLVLLFAGIGWWRFEDLRISNPEYYNYYLQLWVLTVISWLAVGQWSGIYRYSSGLEQRNVTANLLRAALAQFAVLAIIVVGLKGYYYSRVFLATFFGAFYLLVWLSRMLLVYKLRTNMSKGKWQQSFVLVGQNETAEAFVHLVQARSELGWALYQRMEGAQFDELESEKIDEVVCAAAPNTSEYVQAQWWADQHGKRFRYLPEMGAHYAGQMTMDTLEGIPIFTQRKEPLALWSNALLKRIFDVVFSLVFLIAFFSWMFLLSILLLWITGIKKPLFIQKRLGHGGTPFAVLKFRTMNDAGESNAMQQWMRKTGWDELPQLWNVFVGHMSLVGPRPHTPEDVEHYATKVQSYKIRHWAKPGMTGLAQSRGLRGGGESASEALLEERIRADVYYVENWSFLLDLRIVLETLLRTLFYPSSLHRKK